MQKVTTEAKPAAAAQAATPAPPPAEPEDVFATAEQVEFDESDRAGGTGTVGTAFFGIAQRTGKNKQKIQHAGEFFTKTTDGTLEFYSPLDVIALDSSPCMTRFGDDERVECRSRDGQTGGNGECRKCSFFPFNSQSTVSDKDRCKSGFLILCLDADMAFNEGTEPFFLQLTAGAIRTWKDYAFYLQSKKQRPVFSAITRVTTEERESHGNLHFVPVFKPVKALTKEQTEQMRNLRIAESKRFKMEDAPVDTQGNGAEAGPAYQEVYGGGEEDPFENE